jgi:prepilin-type N-terminal cleavage/methylation domain-containing protein
MPLFKEKMKFARGFTLVEIAAVLLIIGLVAGSMLGPLSKQIEQRKINDTQKILEENRDALLGFAASRGYLPCPAISATDGNEGPRTSNVCNNLKGFLPWVVLGTAKSDSWGRLLKYSVTSVFTNPVSKVTSSAVATHDILSSSSPATKLAAGVPVVILSYGPNGNGATLDNGTATTNPSTSNVDEQTNLGNSTTFISRVPTENTTASGGEFDDIVIWIPTGILFNRMVAAGQVLL